MAVKNNGGWIGFVDVSDEFLNELLDNSIPQKTKKATKYEMKIFNGKKTMKTKKMVHILRVLIHGMKFSREIFVCLHICKFDKVYKYINTEWFSSQNNFSTAIDELEKGSCVIVYKLFTLPWDKWWERIQSFFATSDRSAIDRFLKQLPISFCFVYFLMLIKFDRLQC